MLVSPHDAADTMVPETSVTFASFHSRVFASPRVAASISRVTFSNSPCTGSRRHVDYQQLQSFLLTPLSQSPNTLFSASTTSSEGRGWCMAIHCAQYALATLIQGVAPAFRHQPFQQPSHGLYSVHQMLQLRQLSLRERPPAFRSASNVAEAKKQVSDFSQCKTELTGTLNDCQAVKHPWIVTSLPAEPVRRGKQANLLVIANRRRSKSNLPCDLRDG